MLTPKEAYDLFLKKYPDAKGDTIADWGDFYSCSLSASGDMTDDDYKINKMTGDISYWDFAEYAEFVRGLPDEFNPKVYKVKDLK